MSRIWAVSVMRGGSGLRREKALFGRVAEGEWLGPRNPSAGEAVLQKLRWHEGDLGSQYHVTRRVQTAGIDPSEQGGDLLRRLSRR